MLKEIFVFSVDPFPEPFDQDEEYADSNQDGEKEENDGDKKANKDGGKHGSSEKLQLFAYRYSMNQRG